MHITSLPFFFIDSSVPYGSEKAECVSRVFHDSAMMEQYSQSCNPAAELESEHSPDHHQNSYVFIDEEPPFIVFRPKSLETIESTEDLMRYMATKFSMILPDQDSLRVSLRHARSWDQVASVARLIKDETLMNELVDELAKKGVGLYGCLSVDKYNTVIDMLLRRQDCILGAPQDHTEEVTTQGLCLDPVPDSSMIEEQTGQPQNNPIAARFAQAKTLYLEEVQKLKDKKMLLDNEFLREVEIYKAHQESLKERDRTGE